MWRSILCLLVLIEFYEAATKSRTRKALSDSILDFEYLVYSRDLLKYNHHRIRRSSNPHEEIKLDFSALGRHFKLRLQRDSSLFHPNVEISSDGKEDFHIGNIFEGSLEDDLNSIVTGFIHNDIFQGKIYTGDGNEYHVEDSSQYFEEPESHSVIYDVQEIVYPEQHVCGFKKANVSAEEATKTSDSPRTGDEDDYVVFDDLDHKHEKVQEKYKPQVHKRARRSFEASKTVCYLHVRADYTYRDQYNSDDQALYQLASHVKTVSEIYNKTSFAGGSPEGIELRIKKMTIIRKDECKGSECNFNSPNIGVEQFLNFASMDNHDSFCLSYVFSHRDFSNGVLGLAWIGSAENAPGGICQKHQSINGKMQSLNTGIVTNLNYGRTVPSKVTDITFAHEVGHNFGSQHDPVDSTVCAPGDSGYGNYIMYPRATQGSKKNNYKFSSCSKNQIWKVLQVKDCFEESGKPICGNKVVEAGEECDCGYKDDQTCLEDICCHGQDVENPSDNVCKLKNKPTADKPYCSPSQGICCSPKTCLPDNTITCREKTDCAAEAKCTSASIVCPNSTNVPDDTYCSDNKKVCLNGKCEGSICRLEAVMKQPCQCEKEEEFCHICCRKDNSSTCTSLHKESAPKQQPAGAPCDNYNGYCDMLNFCRKVDAEGPLSRLKKWLLNPKTFDNILDWMKKYWWACILIGLGLILFMAGFIAVCSVHTPSSNPHKPPPRPMTLPRTLTRRGRRGQSGPSAPPMNRGGGGRPLENGPPGYNTAVREGHAYPPGGSSYEMGYR